jgi:hypothetical protein
MYDFMLKDILQSQIILSRTNASQPLNRHSSAQRCTIVDACKFYFPKIVAKPRKLPAKARKHGLPTYLGAQVLG